MEKMFSKDAPVFEIGPKIYTYGNESVKLAQHADQLAEKYDVQIIYSAQYFDVRPIAEATKNIFVFAQHVDGFYPGRGLGGVLPEAARDAGAVGTLLNHAEHPLTLNQLYRAICRCREAGLVTMVCAESLEECTAVIGLGADAVLNETAEMIGMGNGKSHGISDVETIEQAIHSIVPDMLVLHGAGIQDEKDVYNIIRAGAKATGATSAIFASPDPYTAMEKMICAVRQAWDDRRKPEQDQNNIMKRR